MIKDIRVIFAVAMGVVAGQFGWALLIENSSIFKDTFLALSPQCGSIDNPCHIRGIVEETNNLDLTLVLDEMNKGPVNPGGKKEKPDPVKNPFDELDGEDPLKGLKLFNLNTTKGAEKKVQQRTFAGYPCKKSCIGHKSGFLWARKNKITITQTCRNTSVSFAEGCRFYLLERNFNPNRDDQGNLIP